MSIKYSISIITLLACLLPMVVVAQETKHVLSVNHDQVISSFDKSMLLGTNAGVYYEESYLMNLQFLDYLKQLNPGIIRIPGGSWSNELYWNGNKVRTSEESYIDEDIWNLKVKNGGNPINVAFDTSRYKNATWGVDYSGYAPGFRIRNNEHGLSDFHGFTDVLFLHKFIQSFGAETMVTVNVGTGTVEMAVEWVKWTKQRAKYLREPFNVKYWEMGNELDGAWELGYYLPDGSEMDAKEYVRRYKLFATAMKKADPTIKVGGSVASSMALAFIEELIQDTDAPIDFISFHAYPSQNEALSVAKMFNEAAKVGDAVNRIKSWLAKYRPGEEERIEIAVTEWNIKVKEDITTVDIRNALWSSVMIGEMAKAKVDIAIQWDMFSTTSTGGHGLFNPNDPEMKPRSQYWAMYLWRYFMGNKMVSSQLEAPEYVRLYSTIDNKQASIMIINGSEDEELTIELQLPDLKNEVYGQEISFSNKQYSLNLQTLIPDRSTKPTEQLIKVKKEMSLTLAPYSIKIIRFKLDSNAQEE